MGQRVEFCVANTEFTRFWLCTITYTGSFCFRLSRLLRLAANQATTVPKGCRRLNVLMARI